MCVPTRDSGREADRSVDEVVVVRVSRGDRQTDRHSNCSTRGQYRRANVQLSLVLCDQQERVVQSPSWRPDSPSMRMYKGRTLH